MKNRFSLSEFSGAFGDLGTLLPLAFALIIFNDFSPERIFFLWGIVYFLTGYFFKVPLSVQPLKAMAVIAITSGLSNEYLSSTSVFYGVLLLFLYLSGTTKILEKFFSKALIKGVQIGIGLILAYKATEMLFSKGFYLNESQGSLLLNISVMALSLLLIYFFQFYKKMPIMIFLILGSVTLSLFSGIRLEGTISTSSPFSFALPDSSIFFNCLVLLMIPQLPLTFGNAVFAADSTCHSLFKEQAKKVSTAKLTLSIGLSNIFIGLLGGFPVCHGAGGITAHNKFGAKTGGATMIMGAIFIILALVKPLSSFLFYIPIPVLAALLFVAALGMLGFAFEIDNRKDLLIAMLVALISFTTKNLAIAIAAGFILEKMYLLTRRKIKI